MSMDLKNINVQQILDFVLPKVKEGKEQEATELVQKGAASLQKKEENTSEGGLSGLLGNLHLGNLDLGNLDVAGIVTKLSTLIKPEYLTEVKDFLSKHLLGQK